MVCKVELLDEADEVALTELSNDLRRELKKSIVVWVTV